MPEFTKTTLGYFLQGLSKIMFLIAGISFLFGGRALCEFEKLDFVLAEFLGLAFAAMCIAAGFIAKSKAEEIEWAQTDKEAMKTTSSHN
jgi:hypothetical protein